jgi:hypothetical protein
MTMCIDPRQFTRTVEVEVDCLTLRDNPNAFNPGQPVYSADGLTVVGVVVHTMQDHGAAECVPRVRLSVKPGVVEQMQDLLAEFVLVVEEGENYAFLTRRATLPRAPERNVAYVDVGDAELSAAGSYGLLIPNASPGVRVEVAGQDGVFKPADPPSWSPEFGAGAGIRDPSKLYRKYEPFVDENYGAVPLSPVAERAYARQKERERWKEAYDFAVAFAKFRTLPPGLQGLATDMAATVADRSVRVDDRQKAVKRLADALDGKAG